MSQENMEVVRRHVEAWNRRDMATLSALWRSDAEIDWSRARGPLKGVYRGRGERETFWNEFYSTFEEAHIEAQGFIENGQITRLRMFQERAEALEAAGLQE
jgi:ketosteroid isomerase-like protein